MAKVFVLSLVGDPQGQSYAKNAPIQGGGRLSCIVGPTQNIEVLMKRTTWNVEGQGLVVLDETA